MICQKINNKLMLSLFEDVLDFLTHWYIESWLIHHTLRDRLFIVFRVCLFLDVLDQCWPVLHWVEVGPSPPWSASVTVSYPQVPHGGRVRPSVVLHHRDVTFTFPFLPDYSLCDVCCCWYLGQWLGNSVPPCQRFSNYIEEGTTFLSQNSSADRLILFHKK